MSGPKFRFAVVVGFVMVLWWLFNVASSYLWGEQGLDFALYGRGILQLGAAVLCGFSIVWLAVWLASKSLRKKTGFEPVVQDEYGTIFKMGLSKEGFGMSLSKFLPEIIAAPAWSGLSPLEAELIGFLNGYRHWPAELGKEEKLYDRAMQRWRIMRDLPGTGPWHRVMALASDLSRIYAYREIRTSTPFWRFWEYDKVQHIRRTREHGGLSAFILSTLPSFRALAQNDDQDTTDIRRSLLTALRYMDDPRLLPYNVTPLARELLEYWQRTEAAMLSSRNGQQALTADDIQDFKVQIKSSINEAFASLDFAEGASDNAEALRLTEQRVIVRPTSLLSALARQMPSATRVHLQLWDGAGVQHPIWEHLVSVLKDQNLWVESFNDMLQPPQGWEFEAEDLRFGPAIMLDLQAAANLQQIIVNAPVIPQLLTPSLSREDVKHILLQHGSYMQALLQSRF